jgi:UDP-N-acetylglucosamine 2-epimerase (non-hydrolysing)
MLMELRENSSANVELIHTGQHFDDNMSAVFFRDLGLPKPGHFLGIHSGSHGEMTGRMLVALEACLRLGSPDMVMVFGDTNSTLAGALAAAKLNIRCVHVEAGMRSWNRSMPEEVNRVLVDHASTLLFCSTDQAVRNLAAEGIGNGVHMVGDIMFDAVRLFSFSARQRAGVLAVHNLQSGEYFVLTLHRAGNTEDPACLSRVLSACGRLSGRVLFPVHPRTRPLLGRGIEVPGNVILSEPLGYLEMLGAIAGARTILTDSGGMQKEAYFLGVPCVTLRLETEWVETVSAGWNILAGTDPGRMIEAVDRIQTIARTSIACFGDGTAARKIRRILESEFVDSGTG